MSDDNYYDILGVKESASENEIKKRYKVLAKEWHPDKHTAENKIVAEEKFKKIAEAYSILSDSEKRQTYDNFGKGGLNMEEFNPFERRHEYQIEDLVSSIELTLEQNYNGGDKIMKTITRLSLCTLCDGSDILCPTCRGRGFCGTQSKSGMFGQLPCKSCHGKGKNLSKICKKCNGERFFKETVEIEVKIPRGGYEQYPIVVEEEGHGLLPEHAEKLEIQRTKAVFLVTEKPHPVFKRFTPKEKGKTDNNMDLLIEIPITLGESILGFNKTIKHLDNRPINFCISKPCRHGDLFVLKGCGMPSWRNYTNYTKFGDLFVSIQVERLNKLSKDEKATFSELFDTPLPNKKIPDSHEVTTFDEYKIEKSLSDVLENIEQQRQKSRKRDIFSDLQFPMPKMRDNSEPSGCQQQ